MSDETDLCYVSLIYETGAESLWILLPKNGMTKDRLVIYDKSQNSLLLFFPFRFSDHRVKQEVRNFGEGIELEL